MRVIYIADDGKEFNDEYECKDYEWILNRPHLKDVHFYDAGGNELCNIFSEDTYNKTEKIIVSNEIAVKTLQEFTDYTGYCAYESIDRCGEWLFDYNKETFVKV